MRGSRMPGSQRLGTYAAILLAAIGGFGAFVPLELGIATITERSAETARWIEADENALRRSWSPTLAKEIETQIHVLFLDATTSLQRQRLFGELRSIATDRKIRLVAVRSEATTPSMTIAKQGRRFAANVYRIVLDGSYPDAVRALADLSRARLVCRVEHVAIERLRASAQVRATLDLTVFRLANADVRTLRS